MIVTDHAEHRQKQRNIPQAAVDYILRHGKMCRKRNAIHHMLTSAHLASLPRHHEAHRYSGIRVITSNDQRVVITIYWERNRRCRKPNARPTPFDWHRADEEAC